MPLKLRPGARSSCASTRLAAGHGAEADANLLGLLADQDEDRSSRSRGSSPRREARRRRTRSRLVSVFHRARLSGRAGSQASNGLLRRARRGFAQRSRSRTHRAMRALSHARAAPHAWPRRHGLRQNLDMGVRRPWAGRGACMARCEDAVARALDLAAIATDRAAKHERTVTMKLSVACNFDEALLDGLAGYPVYEIYGKLTSDYFGGGRPSFYLPEVNRRRLERYVDARPTAAASSSTTCSTPPRWATPSTRARGSGRWRRCSSGSTASASTRSPWPTSTSCA